MNKLKIILPSILTFLIIAFAIGFYYRFKFLNNRQSEMFINEKFINKKIRGHLSAIVKYKQDKVVLGIDNHEEFELTYGVLCIDSSFLKTLQEKDSVYKDIGEEYLNFIKKDGKFFRLKVVFCDL